jgi:HK97 family phage prohead protease
MMGEQARFRSIEVRAGKDEGTFEGFAAVWGAKYRIAPRLQERVRRGAFGPSRVVPLYGSHDHNSAPIGVAKVRDHPHGAHLTGTLYTDSPAGQSYYRAIKDGTLTALSVGFIPTKVERSEDGAGETVEEIVAAELLETSIVLKGASPEAQILSVRHASHPEPKREVEVSSTRDKLAAGMRGESQEEYMARRIREFGWTPDPTQSAGDRLVASAEYRRVRSQLAGSMSTGHRGIDVSTADETAARLRAVTAPTLAQNGPAKIIQPPSKGGRVAPLCDIVPVERGGTSGWPLRPVVPRSLRRRRSARRFRRPGSASLGRRWRHAAWGTGFPSGVPCWRTLPPCAGSSTPSPRTNSSGSSTARSWLATVRARTSSVCSTPAPACPPRRSALTLVMLRS